MAEATQPRNAKAQPGEKGYTAPGTKSKQGTGSKRGRGAKDGRIEIEPLIGTRDFAPEDMRQRNWLFGHFREVARQFAFQEYDAPVLELAELYNRKADEDITHQMYNFVDKDHYEVTLRPEMTPSLARLIMKKGKAMLLPVRWFSIPQCWRFENITTGRKREHYQWNMDIVGVSAITAEVELLTAIVSFFKRVGLTSQDVVIKVNSRKVLQSVLEPLGVTGDGFAPVCVVVDKLDKLSEQEVVDQLKKLELKPEVIEKIKTTLTIKDLDQLETVLPSDSQVVRELRELWRLAAAYGIADWIVFDASVVRGLAYYTGVVFEAVDRAKKFRAICGGGRYDTLFSKFGNSQDVACAGFGFGDCVIVKVLSDKGLLPEVKPNVDYLIIAYDEEHRAYACQTAARLRDLGASVDVQLIPKKKVGWCYEYANRINAREAVFVAPDEWKRGEVRVKDLRLPETAPAEEKEKNISFDSLLVTLP